MIINGDNNKAPGYYAGQMRDGDMVTGTVQGVRYTMRWFPYGGTFTVILPWRDNQPSVFDLTPEDMGDRLVDLVPRLYNR